MKSKLLTWNRPPEGSKITKGGRTNGSQWESVAKELRKNPGEWVQFTYYSNKSAAAMKSELKTSSVLAESCFEFASYENSFYIRYVANSRVEN